MIAILQSLAVLVVLLVLPLSSSLAAEVPASGLIGKYGFDWLKPEKAKCTALNEKNLSGLKSCEHLQAGDTGSFTGKSDFYTCKVGPKSEYMVYKTQARCAEELETMQANGP